MRQLLTENTLVIPITSYLGRDKDGAPGDIKINDITITKKNLKQFNLHLVFSNKIADVYSTIEITKENYIWVERTMSPTYIINYKNLRKKRVSWAKIDFGSIIRSLSQDESVLTMMIKHKQFA